MFHLEYPQFRGFFTWDELGCLARALGFPIDLFKENLAEEIEQEEHGLCIKEVYKMLDNRLLERAVHRTQNLHTAEWNMNAIRKAAALLDHQAISFEDLYNARIAYQAYEGFDMLGLHLEKQTLLNTLKMCGRSIAPMKLLNRVKHMTNVLEEKGRIQLYEFLDLIMWCGHYENFSLEDIAFPAGKERDLFKLVDFEKLLSHHDERLAEKLNSEYLLEEWDFGREHLGTRHMFKEPPIRCAEDRIDMTRRQKRLYRHLKSEVNKSQRGVYRAKAGYIRERPLTAPDLSMYTPRNASTKSINFSAQTAYQRIQNKVKLARPGDGVVTDTSDRPLYVEAEPVEKPCGITEDDLQDTQKKFEVLQFDMETIDGRFQIIKEDTMDMYYPGHKDRHQEDRSVLKPRPKSEMLPSHNNHEEITLKERPKSESHLLQLRQAKKVATKSASRPNPSVSSTKMKDGQFKRRYENNTRKGHYTVTVKPSSSKSYQGCPQGNISKMTDAPVQKVENDFLYQQTNKNKVTGKMNIHEPRPSTAPVKMNSDTNDSITEEKKVARSDKDLSPAESCKTDLSAADSCRTVDTGYSSFDERSSTLEESKAEKPHTSYSDRQSLSHSHSATSTRNSSSGTKKDSQLKKVGIEIVPHMDHSKPRPVSVGGIGTISLLENISEARYWEDAYNVDITDEASSDDSDAHTLSSTDSGISRRQGDELQSSLALLKQRLSEEPVQTKVKDKLLKTKSKFKCQDQNTLEKEMRIKRQRRLQQPRARTNQNLVISSESIKSKCESGSRQAISSTVGKEQAINIDHKPLVRQSDGKLARSVSAPMSSTFHHKDKSSEKREKISYTNNAKGKKISKLEAEMTKVLNKNPKVGRLVKRGEGLLSPDLMKKLISTLA